MSFDSTWEQVHRAREWSDQPEFWWLDVLRRRFDGSITFRTGGIEVLDLGCGGGAISLTLASTGAKVHAIDGSEAAIELTRRRFEERKLAADLRVLDAGRILEAFGPESMDWVIDNACIQSCRPEDQTEIVRQIREVLRPGGWIYSRMAAAGSWGDGMGRRVGENCYTDIPEGPGAGMGTTTFSALEDISRLWGWIELVGNRISLDYRRVWEGTYSEPADREGIRPEVGGARRWWMEWIVEGRMR